MTIPTLVLVTDSRSYQPRKLLLHQGSTIQCIWRGRFPASTDIGTTGPDLLFQSG